jgi:Skp family chaperone for outer membrane proteins
MNILRPAVFATGLALFAVPVMAQPNPGYFIPPAAGGAQQSRPTAPSRPAPSRPQPAPAPSLLAPPGGALTQQQQQPEPEPPPINVTLPPVPDLPALPRGASPPAAVVGVLGIPDIMRASTAAQQIEKIIGERREKLNEDAQKEQGAWRDLQQTLANQRATLSAEQIRTKEKELQERITNAQKTFRDRNRIIQESGQYGLAQIERMLIAVIRQVAESRGMNLVMHRAQVALNVNEFDITESVVAQLNKVLPAVVLPPDGVSPATFAPAQAAAPPGATPSAAAPAAAPAATPAAPAPAPAAPRK